MKPPHRVHAATAVGAALLLLTGCTTSPADNGTSTPTTTSPTATPRVINPDTTPPTSNTPSPSLVEPPTPTPSPPDPTAQEAADRAAIQAQWASFWHTYVGIVRTPADQRAVALDSVSVEPLKGRVLKDAADFEAEGLDRYGDVILNVYTIDLLPEGNSAVIRDCQDQSGFGSLYVDTGKKRTVGIVNNHIQAGLVRGEDNIWRVQTVQYLENVPC